MGFFNLIKLNIEIILIKLNKLVYLVLSLVQLV